MGKQRSILDSDEAGRLSARLRRFKAGKKWDVPTLLSHLGICRRTWYNITRDRYFSKAIARRICYRLGWDYDEVVRCDEFDRASAVLTPALLQRSASFLKGENHAGRLQLAMAGATMLYSEMVVRSIPVLITSADLTRPYASVILTRGQSAREASFYVDRKVLCYQLSTLNGTSKPVLEGFGLVSDQGLRFALEFLVRGHEAATGAPPNSKRAYSRLSETFANLSRKHP